MTVQSSATQGTLGEVFKTQTSATQGALKEVFTCQSIAMRGTLEQGQRPDLLVELEDEVFLCFAAVLQRCHVHVSAGSGLCSQAHNLCFPLLDRFLQTGPLQRSQPSAP